MTSLHYIIKALIFLGIIGSATGIWIALIQWFKSIGQRSKVKPPAEREESNWIYFKSKYATFYYAFNPVNPTLITVIIGSVSQVKHVAGEGALLSQSVKDYTRKSISYQRITDSEFVDRFNQVSDKFDFSN